MTRQELLSSPGYWIAGIQTEIYRCAEQFMRDHHMNRTQLAEYLGVSKGYVTQLLNGDYNFSLEKLVDLSLKIGYVPKMDFQELAQALALDAAPIRCLHVFNPNEYSCSDSEQGTHIEIAA